MLLHSFDIFSLSPITLEATSSMHFLHDEEREKMIMKRKKNKKTFLCCYSPPHKNIFLYKWCDDVCALCTLSCDERGCWVYSSGVKRMQAELFECMSMSWLIGFLSHSFSYTIVWLNNACTFTCHIATITKKSSSRRLREQRKCINSHSNWHMNFLNVFLWGWTPIYFQLPAKQLYINRKSSVFFCLPLCLIIVLLIVDTIINSEL